MMKTSAFPVRKTKISALLFESFKAILERSIQVLTRSHELQVCRKKDRNGNTYWQAFDPKTRKSTSLSSEAEMRIWIEQRYYHSD